MGLRLGGFLVANGASHLVGHRQPNGQNSMKQQCGKQADFEHLDDDVGTHEVTEGVVPLAAVMPQNEQVGAGMKQQEETQESAQGADEDFLGNGMDFREVHSDDSITDCKSRGF